MFGSSSVLKPPDLGFLDLVKLVNYVRSEVQKGNRSLDISSKSVFQDERYLLPVLEDDALLFSLDEVAESSDGPQVDIPTHEVQGQKLDESSTLQSVLGLQEELERLKQQFAAYRKAVDETLEKRWNSEDQDPKDLSNGVEKLRPANVRANGESQYFTSYSYNGQHFQRSSGQS